MRIRYGWELALAALLVIEIVAFGVINPRMLDLNMLLFEWLARRANNPLP